MTKRFYIQTLGCKVNQYESEAIREAWITRGFEQSADMLTADIVVVNSCAVTSKAVADVPHTVRQINRTVPTAQIIITGCAAKIEAESFAQMPGVARVVMQGDKINLANFKGSEVFPTTSKAESSVFPPNGIAEEKQASFQPFIISTYERSRAVVKVQDGCSHRCTYCIVPITRGASCSRQPAEVLAEVERLLAAGFREIGLSGVNLRQYGKEFADRFDFLDLLLMLEKNLASKWSGQMRLRLSSLEPGQLTERALDVFGNSSLLAPHLHLSLQSGSASVLRRMGRGHYNAGMALDFTKQLAKVWSHFGLGADILTGFPDESNEEFLETIQLCNELPLTYAHVFPYSKRPHTPAASMQGQVAVDVKKERAKILRELVSRKKLNFLEKLLDVPEQWVVAEREQTGKLLSGVNGQYADCEFAANAAIPDGKGLILVRPRGVKGEKLLVSPVNK